MSFLYGLARLGDGNGFGGGRLKCNGSERRGGDGSGLRPDDHASRWGHNHNWPRGSDCSYGRPGDYGASGRPGCNGRRSRGRHHNGRCGTRLRHNLARLGTGWHRCCGNHRSLRCGWLCGRGCRRRLGTDGRMALPRFLLFLLLVGQNGLHHIAGLGDVGEIDFGLQTLRSARRRAALGAAPGIALKLRANLVRFVVFERTGVGLAAGQAELRQ